MTVFTASQFNRLGGVAASSHFDERDDVFEALRQSMLVRQSLLRPRLDRRIDALSRCMSDICSRPNLATANFFSSGLRQKVDQLMDILWAGGVNNPMDSIEQISYLLFLRLLTEKDELLASLDKRYNRIFSGKWARYRVG